MAKLSAHGCTVLAQVSKLGASRPDDTKLGVVKRRTTLAFRSDGKLMEKYDVWFTDQYAKNGVRQHSYGWKVKGKIKATITPEMFIANFTKIGYVEE